jgi:diguanylate cyclase (GGDEF)-like protein/PAS domain S-box-containing protein
MASPTSPTPAGSPADPFPAGAPAELSDLRSALETGNIVNDLLDNLGEAVYLVDGRRTIRYWNHACEEISGYSADEVVGRHCYDDILRHVDDEGNSLCHGQCPLAHTIHDGCPRSAHIFLHHKQGHRLPVSVRVQPIREPASGRIIGGVELFTDESALAANEERMEELETLALTDPLTGVPNRRYVEMSASSRLSELRRHGIPMQVAFIDIDHFKRFNDEHGHDVGDTVLRVVATTLAGNLRDSDIVGRVGGEEFVLLLVHGAHDKLESICERLRMLVERASIDLPGGESVGVTISVGATRAEKTDNVDSLLKRADTLLYDSKGAGRNRVTIA